MRPRLPALLLAPLLLGAVAACTPRVIPAGPPITTPVVAPDALVMADGVRLPLHVWRPAPQDRPVRAVLVALQGSTTTP